MTESHFFYLHKQVIEFLKSSRNASQVFTAMHVKKIVSVGLSKNDGDVNQSSVDADATGESVATTSQVKVATSAAGTPHQSQGKVVTVKKSCRGKQKKAKVSVDCSTETGPDLLENSGKTISTQTEETCFERDLLKELRLMYCVDEIREEDFVELW